jgi:glucose uptake protein GlcU
MDTNKMAGYILYAIGIIGGVEAALKTNEWDKTTLVMVSIIALIVIAIGAYLLQKE